VIHGGKAVDGSGAPWYWGDVAIKDGKIAAIGRIDPTLGKRAIDATGLVVVPGFFDMMGQTAAPFLKDPNAAVSSLPQGITTLNPGGGEPAAPLEGKGAAERGWTTMRQSSATLDASGMPMNMVQTVGHTQLRQIVIGDKDRQATSAELDRMRA